MVNGTTDGRFLDHPSYDGLLAAAVELDVPIYIHPHIAARAGAAGLLSELPEGAGRVLETAGWGWHSETAVHLLRMVVAGTLDRHPKLKLIIGHMGEMLPMMMARADQVFRHDIGISHARSAADHPRPGLDHHQRHFRSAAVPRGAADLRHRPHHVLGRLSVRGECLGPEFLDSLAFARRQSETRARQGRCGAEAQGVAPRVKTEAGEEGRLPGWRSLRESNPCFSLERAAS